MSVDPTDQEKPVMRQWEQNPENLMRPWCADSIKASGHAAASKGRTHDCSANRMPLMPILLATPGPFSNRISVVL
jgi:hypothetical protein